MERELAGSEVSTVGVGRGVGNQTWGESLNAVEAFNNVNSTEQSEGGR
jgi:hypothetical protein